MYQLMTAMSPHVALLQEAGCGCAGNSLSCANGKQRNLTGAHYLPETFERGQYYKVSYCYNTAIVTAK